MNFDFTDDQAMLRDNVRKYLSKESPLGEARRVLEQRDSHSSPVWQGLVDMGIATLMLPEHAGGIGLGALELCVVAEEIGRQLSPVPLSSTLYLAAQALLLGSDAAQQGDWLAAIAGGDIASLAAPLDGNPATLPRYSAGRLNGCTELVPDGQQAAILVVLAEDDDGQPRWVVCRPDAATRREALSCIDMSRPWSRLTFEQQQAEPLNAVDDALALLARVRDRAAILLAFEQLGASDAVLEISAAYARERHAFGRAIGSYQGIKHKLADIYTLNQLARAHCYYGAWALSSDAPELSIAAAAARVSATRALDYAAQESIQVHGGMGYTWELDCHLFYRRARQQAVMLGGEDLWNEQIASLLEQRLRATA